MHLKLYWKLQKKERPLEVSRDTLRTPMSHGKANGDVKTRASYMKPTVLPSASLVKASSRKPFGILSPNVLCSMSGKSPVENSLNVKAKKNVLSAAVHQSEEGLPGTWAIVKPGNTKEKIAFFAAHQYSNRIGSMKIKSSWDIDGRATKRRKKSGDLKKAKLQLEMMRDINSQCYQSEPFVCGVEHCSVHYMSDSGDSVCAARPLSVIQMVAFLEQKATALLASCTVEKDRPAALDSLEEPLPGMLFFLSSGQDQQAHPQLREHPAPEASEASQPQDAAEGSSAGEEKDASVEPLLPAASPGGSTSQVLEAATCKKQVSQDFLETRFKIQQLLEPQQYMACLPHHIIVKIFRLLPTLSLAILKCTCRYFKSIIEYYNIRPADSRWVRDPRYREDPCKQCKKKYVKGDVSLCRWHPKPYCQALPYGPGYWMCCHQSQKGFPGCKLGLHDNHWLPACHSFNRAIHKKTRGSETEEEY